MIRVCGYDCYNDEMNIECFMIVGLLYVIGCGFFVCVRWYGGLVMWLFVDL